MACRPLLHVPMSQVSLNVLRFVNKTVPLSSGCVVKSSLNYLFVVFTDFSVAGTQVTLWILYKIRYKLE